MQTATVTTSMVMVCITSALMAAFKPPYKTKKREWEMRVRIGQSSCTNALSKQTYHNCKEYADDGHANYGGPIGYTNHSRQCHTGRIDGYAKITDLPHNIRGRGEAAYGATLESETI